MMPRAWVRINAHEVPSDVKSREALEVWCQISAWEHAPYFSVTAVTFDVLTHASYCQVTAPDLTKEKLVDFVEQSPAFDSWRDFHESQA